MLSVSPERLTSVFPGGVKAKIAFGNCGSDGNDAAVKFARAYTGRQKIIVFINGYHGNTYGSSTMTTCSTKMHEKMGPFLPEIYAFPFFGNDVPDDVCERDCVSAIETAFSTWLPANEVAAVVIEPIQGDAGILPAHPIFMKKLFELCRKHGMASSLSVRRFSRPSTAQASSSPLSITISSPTASSWASPSAAA